MPFKRGQPGHNTLDLTGHKYGQLTVIRFVESRNKRRYWLVTCECGVDKQCSAGDLRGGRLVSCGCYKDANTAKRNKNSAKHGMTGSPTWISWMNMLARCEYPGDRCFRLYGGRGISVCERWHDFRNFYVDMGERPNKKTIDRINNDLGYFKENCRWATAVQQSLNRRVSGNSTAER